MSSPDTPAITLHWLEKSRSQRILWLLEEFHVPYEVKTYKRNPKTMLAPPELKTIHPLGKSPVITVGDRTIAESALIVEYISEHFGGASLIPSKWKAGCEGTVGGETDEFMRYRYFMHYCEGSLSTLLTVGVIVNNIKTATVPFFIRPITSQIAAKINAAYLDPNFATHFAFLEEQLASAPGGGPYLCGAALTGADILMSFPLMAAQGRSPLSKDKYPKLWAYTEMLKESAGYKRAVAKIVEIDGEYSPNF
ncbi:glutathione S-transferase-like protein [Mycena sp. CBHHK59/15]|nr:glutathione S-transferase-like protein [Mycena sp. CBHHK59/15]